MTRIPREGTPPAAQTWQLHAARGEWESLQVVLSATPEQLKRVEIQATGIAKRNADDLLPAPAVFHEHYVRVSQSTPMAPLPPGDYPDALLPLDMPAQDMGGTELLQPLTAVLGQPAVPGYARQVFVLTDGEVSNTREVIAAVSRYRSRVFGLGLGHGASHELVEGIGN